MCKELDPDSRSQTEVEICEALVIPTDIPYANAVSQSSTSLAHGDLLQEYDRKFAQLLDDQKLSKLCSHAGFLKEIWRGQFFITIQEVSEVMQAACRQNLEICTPRPRGWIRQNKKIDPGLDVKIYPHEGCYCIDIMIESLINNQTVSWVRIVNGINKYVTETSQEISIESGQLDISTGRVLAGTSALLVKSGLSKKRWKGALDCFCFIAKHTRQTGRLNVAV